MSGITGYLDFVFGQIHPCNDRVWSKKRERNVYLRAFLNDCLSDFGKKQRLKYKMEAIGKVCPHNEIEEVEVMNNGKTLMKCKACPWLFILDEKTGGPREPTAEDFQP